MHQQISIHAPRTGSDNGTSKTLNSSAYFNPRSPHGERRKVPPGDRRRPSFQSTLPARGATRLHPRSICRHRHFNPRSPHGERPAGAGHTSAPRIYFNPRSPHGERRSKNVLFFASIYFNPRSPHGERRTSGIVQSSQRTISIHAPRTGSDDWRRSWTTSASAFQSTLPARGATPPVPGAKPVLIYFNPRSPHGERLRLARALDTTVEISIHAPRTGSDGMTIYKDTQLKTFQSTLPARGATAPTEKQRALEGHFNPRSPHGERRWWLTSSARAWRFQSTLPARGATIGAP